ncbi:hypothetical protein Tco_0312743 [Tanacetum coccineum]
MLIYEVTLSDPYSAATHLRVVTVEEVFEFKEVPENKRVSLIATKLRGRASAWWQQLKLTREGWKSKSYQFEEDDEFIEETDDQLVSHYIGGLRVHIIDFVNMFDPVTLSDAYQHALAFEKQNRRVGSSSSPAITGGSSGSGNVKRVSAFRAGTGLVSWIRSFQETLPTAGCNDYLSRRGSVSRFDQAYPKGLDTAYWSFLE